MKRTATILFFSLALAFANVVSAQPGAPTLASPANNSVKIATNADLIWNSPSSVDSFNIQIALDTAFTTIVVDTVQTNLIVYSIPTGKLNNYVVYYWRVRGKDVNGLGAWSTRSNFRTVDRISPAPTLRAPENNFKSAPRLPDFKWDNVTRAARYQIQLSDNSSFGTNKLDTILNSPNNEFTYTKDTLKVSTSYFWRARSENELGWGDWSNASSFEVSFLPPSIPKLLSPANNSTNQPLNGRLDWTTSQQTTRYRLLFDTVPTLENATVYYKDSSLLTSFFDIPSNIDTMFLDSSRTYYWTVAAGNDDDFYSRNSDTFSFTTINLLPPSRPINQSPKSSSVQFIRRPTFVWNDTSKFLPDSFYLHISTFFTFTDTAVLAKTTAKNYTIPTNAPLAPDTVFYWRVAGKNAAGFSPWSYFWNLTTDIKQPVKDAYKATLYPNPAITTTTIAFELSTTQNVRIAVIDITGKELQTVYNGSLNAQKHTFDINIGNLPTGNYYIAIAGQNAMQAVPFIKQ